MNTLPLAQAQPIEPVQLIRDAVAASEPVAATPSVVVWTWIAAAILACIALAAFTRFYWTRRNESPAARANRRIFKLLQLSRPEQQLLAALANGKDPLAFLLSQNAFIRAAAVRQPASPELSDHDAVRALHRKIFEAGGIR